MSSPEPLDFDLAAAFLSADEASLIADLEDRAAKGCSISARQLVNARETLTDLALSGQPVEPSEALTARIALCANKAGANKAGANKAGANKAGADKLVSDHGAVDPDADPRSRVPDSSERLAEIHTASEEDVGRIAEVQQLGADRWRDDDGLDVLISELNGLLRYDVWVIAVLGGATVHHRAVRGFPPELGDMRTTDRRSTFCTHCVSANRPLRVENAVSDPFFRGNRLVWQMGARAYAGVPVHTATGLAIGTLCGVHASSRVIPERHLDILRHYAKRVSAEFERDRTPSLLEAVVDGVRPTSPGTNGNTGSGGASGGHVTSNDWFLELLELELARAKDRAQPGAAADRHWSSLQVTDAATFDLSAEAGSATVIGRLASGELALLRSHDEGSEAPVIATLVDSGLSSAAAWIASAGSQG